jgi:hypothetical protein
MSAAELKDDNIIREQFTGWRALIVDGRTASPKPQARELARDHTAPSPTSVAPFV